MDLSRWNVKAPNSPTVDAFANSHIRYSRQSTAFFAGGRNLSNFSLVIEVIHESSLLCQLDGWAYDRATDWLKGSRHVAVAAAVPARRDHRSSIASNFSQNRASFR